MVLGDFSRVSNINEKKQTKKQEARKEEEVKILLSKARLKHTSMNSTSSGFLSIWVDGSLPYLPMASTKNTFSFRIALSDNGNTASSQTDIVPNFKKEPRK